MSGWKHIQSGVAGQRDTLVDSLKRPDDVQRQLLLRIVERNRTSEIGRRYGFESIRTIDDYRHRVPIHEYEDIRADIDRMMAGAINVLVTDDVIVFEPTGGSSGGSKFLPYTEPALEAFRSAILPWLDDLITSRPGIRSGKAYWAISPVTRQFSKTAGGTPIGISDDSAYFGAVLGQSIVETLAVPPAVAQSPSLDEWRADTIRRLLECGDLSFVSVWSPTFFLQLLEAASELPEWPMLDTISCWRSSSSRRYAAELAERLPQAYIQGKGLLATEGVVTIPLEDASGPVLAINSGFYEFEADDGDVVTAWELDTGRTYGVILTTMGGLYRYRLGDRVTVVGRYEATPCLEFVGRDDNVSDLCGEKLTEEFVGTVLDDIPGFGFLVPIAEPRPAYLLILDADAVADGQEQRAARIADGRLLQNPQYRYARQVGQLPPVEACRIDDPIGAYKDICMESGQRLGDIKPSALASVEWGEQFRKVAAS